jgi:lipoprotein-anchoring transpeptidase ErfK/SrfK
MQKNPWWYPPDSDWAKDAEPVPPGPSNPLGTRWMGLDREDVGIHGTPDSGSLGGFASHGCIRMYIPSAEKLYSLVDVGTPVIIY